MNRPQVLILNSDRLSQKSLYELLSGSGYRVDIANSVKESVTYLDENQYQVVVADIDGGTSGTELVKIIKKRSYPAQVIVLASYGNMEAALAGIQLGALDYLLKPVEDRKIIHTIEKAVAKTAGLEPKAGLFKKLLHKETTYHGLVGSSLTMKGIYSLVDRISNSTATILLRGDSGTGKRMVARAIHAADKRRRAKPFIEMSCGALPREIIESELFGHTKGAFTGAISDRKGRFELAHGGTILLDDIDSFSLDLQVKLLRVLQHKEFERVGDHQTIKVDVRIIASTNQDLEKAVKEKRFREDLYYRLNVISMLMPPLRERKDDLPRLVEYFMERYSKENHKKIHGMSREAMDALVNYNWPGNIRELENIIERAIILDTDDVIEKDDLPEIIFATDTLVSAEPAAGQVDMSSLKDALKEPEKVYILKVLEEVGWNKKKAAEKLGVNRTTLYNKLKKYKLVS